MHPDAKADLATCFVERCISFSALGGSAALVAPQNWLFLGTYTRLRETLLKDTSWAFVARLGPGAFETIGGDVVNVSLAVFSRVQPDEIHRLAAIDATGKKTPVEKSLVLGNKPASLIKQCGQLQNPDSRITLEEGGQTALLSAVAHGVHGLGSKDTPCFFRQFWEVASCGEDWEFLQTTVNKTRFYGGMEQIVFWEQGKGLLHERGKRGEAILAGGIAWKGKGVIISQMNKLCASLYLGDIFDKNTAVILPSDEALIPAVWTFCSSGEYNEGVRKIDQKIGVTNVTLVKVPFDLARWRKLAEEKYPYGLPKPFSSDPTQWLFNGHPAGADQPLHVAVARLVGYLWPRQTGSSFPDCPALGPDGMGTFADTDGIVCLSPARGETAAADRLRSLLSAAFDDEWSNAKERELLLETAVANGAKKPAADLADWLRQNFFAEHCKLFQSRPFIWQVWDGNPHGFSALVNYHKLAAPNGQGRKTLELLTYTYLGDWIDRQRLDQAEGINGADDRLAAALDLQSQLKKILEGEPPYDLFVRWKPLHQQAIGWDPDINDGVRLNIRPFLNAQLRKGGKAGAGILRAKPGTIKWSKDRGKEPMRSKEEFPWFWGWDENDHTLATDFGAPLPGAPPAGDSFDGNRWNDLHYTRAAKEAARARQRGEG